MKSFSVLLLFLLASSLSAQNFKNYLTGLAFPAFKKTTVKLYEVSAQVDMENYSLAGYPNESFYNVVLHFKGEGNDPGNGFTAEEKFHITVPREKLPLSETGVIYSKEADASKPNSGNIVISYDAETGVLSYESATIRNFSMLWGDIPPESQTMITKKISFKANPELTSITKINASVTVQERLAGSSEFGEGKVSMSVKM